jgi:hypothetical protein
VLLGLNAPVASASVTINQSVEATKMTSTERIFAVLDRIRTKSDGSELDAPEEGSATIAHDPRNGEAESS